MKPPIIFTRIKTAAPLFFILLMMSCNLAVGQISITSSDMPSPGDTIRKSNALGTGSVDYTLTGENYSWDFSDLFPLYQTVDEYESVSSVPFLYQLVFIPSFVANLAQKYPEVDTLGLPISDPYRFFKNTSSAFTDVGFAVTVSDIPLPLRFDSPDVIYDFPVNYGNSDSSFSGINFGIPDMGFIGIDRKRVNEVDGWGTLTTSYGSFEVLRLKSKVYETDSIYIDSVSFGYALDRVYTEYKWLANGHETPLLQVTEEGALVTVVWTDSVFNPSTAIAEQYLSNETMSVLPNPLSSDGIISVNLTEKSKADILIYNLNGVMVKQIFSGDMVKGENKFAINRNALNLCDGVYMVQLKTASKVLTQKLIIQ